MNLVSLYSFLPTVNLMFFVLEAVFLILIKIIGIEYRIYDSSQQELLTRKMYEKICDRHRFALQLIQLVVHGNSEKKNHFIWSLECLISRILPLMGMGNVP